MRRKFLRREGWAEKLACTHGFHYCHVVCSGDSQVSQSRSSPLIAGVRDVRVVLCAYAYANSQRRRIYCESCWRDACLVCFDLVRFAAILYAYSVSAKILESQRQLKVYISVVQGNRSIRHLTPNTNHGLGICESNRLETEHFPEVFQFLLLGAQWIRLLGSCEMQYRISHQILCYTAAFLCAL